MTLAWVEVDDPLPEAWTALPGGLVAAGRDLSPTRLEEAYRKGIFPWFSPGDPVLWWSPDPRMVLHCDALHLSHSLQKRIRQFGREPHALDAHLRVTMNTAFDAVITQCADRAIERVSLGAARRGLQGQPAAADAAHGGTWITSDITAVYSDWHRMGRVHSLETWIDDQLVGGLYGVSLGSCFFGESMFSHVADASKVALAYLVRFLQANGIAWIDCQQETPHLARMGAAPLPRARFLADLARRLGDDPPPWGRGRVLPDGRLLAAS